MYQVNDRIVVLNPGDQVPQMSNDSIKLYLAGTMDFSQANTDWQTKFIEGLTKCVDPYRGLLMYKNTQWIIFNPHVLPQNGSMPPNLDNPEFVATMGWRMSMMDMADVVFVNIMNKSKSPIPILELGSLISSGKLVVRCGEEHMIYSQIRLYCEKYQVPLLTGKTSVKDVLLAMGAYTQKFRDLQSLHLPE